MDKMKPPKFLDQALAGFARSASPLEQIHDRTLTMARKPNTENSTATTSFEAKLWFPAGSLGISETHLIRQISIWIAA